MRILVCEDQDSIRSMIATLVTASGHQVTGVASGAQAVECAVTERFDVLLLDLLLPGALDGFEVCRRLRAEETTRTLPIFVLSALDDPETKRAAMEAGASAFHVKPFNPVQLLREIDGLADVGQHS
jgi:DNA-binding response OmpR family regulator